MRQLVEFTPAESTPDLKVLLHREANGGNVPARLSRLFEEAAGLYERLTAPRGLWNQVGVDQFDTIYNGDGRNDPETPLQEIYPRAQRLALFAATIGDDASEQIGELFRRHEPALGYALDVIASAAADLLADSLAKRFLTSLVANGAVSEEARVLPYSPGYCGWHVSGQRRLFEVLQPGTIDVRLSNSFLMRPLKSVSGVLVAGPATIHKFRPVYPFCENCTTHECRGRMASVLRGSR